MGKGYVKLKSNKEQWMERREEKEDEEIEWKVVGGREDEVGVLVGGWMGV